MNTDSLDQINANEPSSSANEATANVSTAMPNSDSGVEPTNTV
jgi:hypothetical protein